MNTRRTVGCLLIYLAGYGVAPAQTLAAYSTHPSPDNQMALFSQLPVRNLCTPESLEKIFQDPHTPILAIGRICVRCACEDKIQQNAQVETVLLRLPDFPGFFCSLVRQKDLQGSIKYSGRVMSRTSATALLLEADHGQYFFVKTAQALLLAE